MSGYQDLNMSRQPSICAWQTTCKPVNKGGDGPYSRKIQHQLQQQPSQGWPTAIHDDISEGSLSQDETHQLGFPRRKRLYQLVLQVLGQNLQLFISDQKEEAMIEKAL